MAADVTDKEDELVEWSHVLCEYIDVEDVVRLILVGYEGLCPTRHQHKVPTLKVIDSIPGSSKVFQDEIEAFQRVMSTIMDPTWSPSDRKLPNFTDRLASARAYLEAAHQDTTTDSTAFHTEA